MRTVKNLKVVTGVLHQEVPNHKFDLLEVLVLARPTNQKIFYVGTKEDNTKTIFKHTDSDNECYYDVLNANEIYYNNTEKLYEADSDNFCTNLESIEVLTKKYIKRKEEVK